MSLQIVVQALGVLILLVLALLYYCSSACRDAQAAASPWPSSLTLPCKPQQAVPQRAPASGPLAPGAWLAGYRLEGLLGKGGFSQVYRASTPTGALVALKLVECPDVGSREALLLSQLAHPSVPRLHRAFPTQYGYCLVQELVSGETLLARMRRAGGRLPVAEVLTVGSQLAQILVELHQSSQPVLHLDVKPENVQVCPDGTVRLLDFGLALLAEAGWPVLGGTLTYAPPEQRSGQVGPRSDVYALGVTLWELLTGACPRPGLGQFPALPATCPLSLRRLLWRMIHVRYEQRPTAGEVAHILRALAVFSQAGGPQRCA